MSERNILPEYTDTLVCNNITFYEETEKLFNIFKSVFPALKLNLELNAAKTSLSPIETISDIFVKMDNLKFIFDDVEMSDNFKLFYIEKFEQLHETIKASIKNTLSDGNTFFKDVSEDIGIMLEKPLVKDGNNIDWFDIFYNNSDIPSYLPASAYNKISNTSKENILFSALSVDAVMKNNMLGVANYNESNLSEKSHGNNLVTDSTYHSALKELADEQSVSIIAAFGQYLGEIILFIKDLNPRQTSEYKTKLISYEGFIEDIQEQLDILNNSIVSTAYKTDDILS